MPRRQFSKGLDIFRLPYFDRQRVIRNLELQRRQVAGRKTLQAFSVAVTPLVREFASHFPATETGVMKMVAALKRKIKFERVKPSVAEEVYGLQSAHDVLLSGKIPTPFAFGKPVYGCNTMCIALAACFRAKKIPVKFVRTIYNWRESEIGISHSLVAFKMGKNWYLSDPFLDGDPMMSVGQKERGRIKILQKKGKWAEGKSPEELGIFSFADYNRFNPTALKHS